MDKEYWSQYYKIHKNPVSPSMFAQYVTKFLTPGKTLLELGCGNARDAVFFAENGIRVTGIDQVTEEIAYLNNRYSNENLKFVEDDFTSIRNLNHKYDFVYSRFTLHAITEKQEDNVLTWVYEHLNPNGLFMLEVRSINDELYHEGEFLESEKHAKITTHFRRFADLDALLGKLRKTGFDVLEAVEDKNFAIHKDENPIVIRIVVKRL